MKTLCLLLMLVMCSPVWADEVSDLIHKLDDSNFLEREKAADRLEGLGQKAIPGLTRAAAEGSLETAVRSIEILKKLMASEDKQTAGEAKSALEKLAQSEQAATARRAKNALDPPKPEPVPEAPPNRIRIPFGRVPAPVARANNIRQVRTQVVNGVKTIEAEENGRKVKIEEDPNKGIRVEITETNNGRQVTKGFEAKTEEDLKKNHPQAHAEYEKYAKGNAVPIRIGGPMAIPPFAVPVPRRADDMRLELGGRLLQSMTRNIESMTRNHIIEGASNESRESLKKQVTEMKNRLEALEKKLETAIDEENKRNAEPAKEKPQQNAQPDAD